MPNPWDLYNERFTEHFGPDAALTATFRQHISRGDRNHLNVFARQQDLINAQLRELGRIEQELRDIDGLDIVDRQSRRQPLIAAMQTIEESLPEMREPFQVPLIAAYVTEWDLTDAQGQPLAISEDTVRSLPEPLQAELYAYAFQIWQGGTPEARAAARQTKTAD